MCCVVWCVSSDGNVLSSDLIPLLPHAGRRSSQALVRRVLSLSLFRSHLQVPNVQRRPSQRLPSVASVEVDLDLGLVGPQRGELVLGHVVAKLFTLEVDRR